jgi:hypothetical protein
MPEKSPKLPSFFESRLEWNVAIWKTLPSGTDVLIVEVRPEARPVICYRPLT